MVYYAAMNEHVPWMRAALSEAAKAAQKQIHNLEFRGKIVQAMRQAGVNYARELAEMAVAETGMGRVEDKIQKNISQAEKKRLLSSAFSG